MSDTVQNAAVNSVEIQKAQLAVGAPKPATPQPVPLAQQVNKAMGAQVSIPKGLEVDTDTGQLDQIWMRAMIYGETNAKKTTVSAKFGSPEDVRIILTRGEDQLLPLVPEPGKPAYKYRYCDTAEKIKFAMMYPERLWPDWATRPNRILVIDDITKGKDILLDFHEYNEKGTKQNNMMVHREAKTDMADLVKVMFGKPMHIIMVAFASIYENPVTHEENVGPDIPPSMMRMLTADFTFVFYIDKAKNMFRTDDYREVYEDVDESMKRKTFTRIITAKHKIPAFLAGKNIVNPLEPLDLQKIWLKIQAAKRGGK